MKLCLTFNDVLIIPKFSNIKSRKDVNTDNGYSKLPIISANMDSVTGPEMARAMKQAGGLACLHRFWSVMDNVLALREGIYEGSCPWVSVGVGEQEFCRAEALFEHGARFFVLDVANGSAQHVVDQYKQLKDSLPNIHLTVGNFATYDSVVDFSTALGYTPDMIKVGVGPGATCETRVVTGVGIPQLSAILDCGRANIPIIADGGCKNSGDIAKALACKNVIMIMSGSLFAGCDETPGEVINRFDSGVGSIAGPITKYKSYRGSASKESYDIQGKNQEYITAEGAVFEVVCKGAVAKVLQTIEGGLRSSFSYVGARNLKEFQEKAEFIRITSNGLTENFAHGKK